MEPSVAALTARDLGRIAGHDDLREVSIRVDRYCFASHTACGCETHGALDRFHAEGMPLPGPCPRCGAERVLHPLYTYREVPGGALAGQLDRTLAELGVSAEACVLVRGPRGSTLIRSAAKPVIALIALCAKPALVDSSESRQEVTPQRALRPRIAARSPAPAPAPATLQRDFRASPICRRSR